MQDSSIPSVQELFRKAAATVNKMMEREKSNGERIGQSPLVLASPQCLSCIDGESRLQSR